MLMLTHRNAWVISKEWKGIKYTWMFSGVFRQLNFAEMCFKHVALLNGWPLQVRRSVFCLHTVWQGRERNTYSFSEEYVIAALEQWTIFYVFWLAGIIRHHLPWVQGQGEKIMLSRKKTTRKVIPSISQTVLLTASCYSVGGYQEGTR